MNAIKFVTDADGKQIGLFIDFEVIVQAKTAGEDMGEFLDTLEDRIALELSRFDKSDSYREATLEMLQERNLEA